MSDPARDEINESIRQRRAALAVADLAAIEATVVYDTPPSQGSRVPQRIENAVAIYCAHIIAEARK